MPRIIGIDLGTTNTAVAVMEGGRPRVIEDERGYKVLPSVISAKGEGKFVVGQAAHNLILTRPERTVYSTKRLIGRRFDSPEVQEAIRRVNYKVRPAPDGGVELMVGDQWMSPTEVAAVVVQVARSIAEKALGERVEEAVITVPAYFNHAQRKATIEAAEMAGLRCDRLLHEPTAAALAFGHRKNVERTILIFDLGGGTFDVSVLRLSSGIYETLSTLGDSYLGGEDIDSRIVDHLVGAFRDRSGVDLTNDKNAVQRIRDAAERAKCELSFSDRTNIVIPHVTPQHSIDLVLTRLKLEEITADLVQRCVDIARRAVLEGGLKLSEVDEVILVGGQTRMPRIREAISALLGREPSRTVHPEEAVAVGAAVHAANLADADQSRTVLLDVTPFDLGIDSAGGLFVPIVHRNSRVPATETRTFATANDNQESVRVTVRQGQSRNSVENEFLGEFVLTGLSAAARMMTKVDVTFRIDGNGMLHVSAIEKGSGERKNITIRNYAEHAASPHIPAPEEARVAEAERLKRQASSAAEPVGKRPGLLDGIFGALKRKKPIIPVKEVGPTSPAAPAAASIAPPGAPELAASPRILDSEDAPVAPEPPPVAAPAVAEPGIIMPLPTPGRIDEMFAVQDEDGVILDTPVEDTDEQVEPPVAVGIAGGAYGAGGGFRDAVKDSPSEAPSELLSVNRMSQNPFENLRSELTDPGALPVAWDEPLAAPNDSQGGFDFRASPDDADFADVGELVEEGGEASSPRGGFAVPEEEIAERFSIPTSEPSALQSVPGSADHVRSVSGADRGAESARTPNEDDTAVMRRGWAWSESEAVPVTPARPVDLGPDPFVRPTDPAPASNRKPARVRLRYPDPSRLGEEYRENLRKGGTFIKTPKPLQVGRECICEVTAPGLDDTLLFPAVVTFVATSGPGQEAGMGIEYRLSDTERRSIERVIDRL